MSKAYERFKLMIESSQDWFWEFDENANFTYVSPSIKSLLGYDPEEIIGANAFDLMDSEEAKRVHKHFDPIAKKYQPFAHLENVNIHKDGHEVIIESSGTPIFDEDGKFCGYRGVDRDITHRKQAEQKLRESEEKFRIAFKTSPDSVNLNRLSDGVYIDINDGFTQLTGYEADEVIGKSSLVLNIWRNKADRTRLVEGLLESGRVENLEAAFVKKNGDIGYGLMSARIIELDGEKVILSITRDITELKRSAEERRKFEQQMVQTQKLESLGVLAGGIAHDFNNLLAAIMGHSELAKRRLSSESAAVENIVQIEQATERAADLAKQMLAYSGKGKFVVEIIDLNRLLEEMLQMLQVSISKKVVLRFSPYSPLPTVNVDATQLRQVVMNLVINASEAIGKKSGIISITTGCMDCDQHYLKDVWLDENLTDGLYVYLEVADTGCGMDKATLAKIFDPFFTTKFTGRGLGMSAIMGIVRGHKGAIKVYSEVGKGSTFKILLPAAEKPAELFNGHVVEEEWEGSGKVLLVDDEESVRGIGTEMLKELGFSPLTANDGQEALQVFKDNPDIVLVILDLTMPKMDGKQCFRELKKFKSDVKVIMSSGYNENEVSQIFIAKGISGFIQKPYRLSTLRGTIKKALNNSF